MITSSRQPTVKTEMPTVGKCLADFYATRTCLACATRVNLNQQSPSILSFVRQHKKELRPSRIIDGLTQHSRSKSFNVQIFNRDQAVLVDDLARLFMMKIDPLCSHMSMDALQHYYNFASPIRTNSAPRYSPLSNSKFPLRVFIVTGILNGASIAQDCKGGQSNINTNSIGREGQRLCFDLADKNRKPSVSFTFDCQGFNVTLDWAMQDSLYKPNFGNSDFVSLQASNYMECHAAISTHGTKSRIANFLTRLGATEKRFERKIDAPQRGLQGMNTDRAHVTSKLANFGQLEILIEPANRLAFDLPCLSSLTQGGIVQFSTYRQMLIERLGLSLAWIDSVFETLYNRISHAVDSVTSRVLVRLAQEMQSLVRAVSILAQGELQ